MMADDMGLGDTSAYLGVRLSPDAPPIERTLRTPNLARFAHSAMVFTDGYAAASMCSATRYSLLTGRFAHRSYLKNQGWRPHGPNTPMLQRALTTLPEMLQANGYHTAGIGKYHVGMSFDDGEGQPADHFFFHDVDFTKPILDGPTHHGFDEYFGVTANTEDPLDTEPRVLIRNDRFTFTDRSRMKLIGMKNREGRILAAPDWNPRNLGPLYLREAESFIDRQSKQADEPFFLYYVPNANHFQRNTDGDYAVPDRIAGTQIKGQSRYSDAAKAGDREDMVLENDVVFGKLLTQLRTTDDPRWLGHKLIENTLVIFTSDNGPNIGDNLGRNQESGGLRGKKAKIREGGIRVPLLVYWKGHIEGGKLNRNVCSLTDIYATLANVAGHSLAPNEAPDSHDCLVYWTGNHDGVDERARIFFCHLGPPYLNDALAIRKGREKLVVDGGLALPSISKGQRGAAIPAIYYDLGADLYEQSKEIAKADAARAAELALELLGIHNRGHARQLNLPDNSVLIQDDGWHNLRNDINGAVGFEFRVRESRVVTHLGMWDDHAKDAPVRPARNVPTEHDRDRSSIGGKVKRGFAGAHTVRLYEIDSTDAAKLLAHKDVPVGSAGVLENQFRYLPLATGVFLEKGRLYWLTMSTSAGDGDHFHDPVAFDGLSPVIHPVVDIVRGVLIRNNHVNRPIAIPAFADMNADYSEYRLPVGPTLKFESVSK